MYILSVFNGFCSICGIPYLLHLHCHVQSVHSLAWRSCMAAPPSRSTIRFGNNAMPVTVQCLLFCAIVILFALPQTFRYSSWMCRLDDSVCSCVVARYASAAAINLNNSPSCWILHEFHFSRVLIWLLLIKSGNEKEKKHNTIWKSKIYKKKNLYRQMRKIVKYLTFRSSLVSFVLFIYFSLFLRSWFKCEFACHLGGKFAKRICIGLFKFFGCTTSCCGINSSFGFWEAIIILYISNMRIYKIVGLSFFLLNDNCGMVAAKTPILVYLRQRINVSYSFHVFIVF